MKKAILVLIVSASFLCTRAQDADFNSYSGIESDKVMNLSADQIAKIKKIKRETGLQFKAIGQSNLPGYEKGRRKRALTLQRKNAIMAVLSDSQISAWENSYYRGKGYYYDRKGYYYGEKGMHDVIKDDYEARLDDLERKYEADKDRIEESSLSKEAMKSKLKALKRDYKAEKERLKNQRDKELIAKGLD